MSILWAKMSNPWGLGPEAIGALVTRAQTMWQRGLRRAPRPPAPLGARHFVGGVREQ